MSVSEELLDKAVNYLHQGKLVAFPTETVYGLGADASNAQALELLYQVKGRPLEHPVIVHISGVKQLTHWAVDIPSDAYELAKAFWPGPLTMVLHRQKHVLDQVTGGQDTVALRVPNHPVTMALLKKFGGGLAAPSANKFGRLSPTTAQDVVAELGNEVSLVLDGGPCDVGIESTIVDLTGTQLKILRPGILTASDLNLTLSSMKAGNIAGNETDVKRIRVPGSLARHYSPVTPVKLVAPDVLQKESEQLCVAGKSVAVLALNAPACHRKGCHWITASSNPAIYAHDLYANLRLLDQYANEVILVEIPPKNESWQAILNRLQRASGLE